MSITLTRLGLYWLVACFTCHFPLNIHKITKNIINVCIVCVFILNGDPLVKIFIGKVSKWLLIGEGFDLI